MKITLAAIVGNEEAVIERFIRSFAPAVDRIILVQSVGDQIGDETPLIAESVAHGLGIPILTDFYDNETKFPHVDHFGNARNVAWDIALAQDEDQFILWADADDILADGAAEAIRTAAESASHDVFLMPYHVRGDKQIVMRERMVKASIGSITIC